MHVRLPLSSLTAMGSLLNTISIHQQSYVVAWAKLIKHSSNSSICSRFKLLPTLSLSSHSAPLHSSISINTKILMQLAQHMSAYHHTTAHISPLHLPTLASRSLLGSHHEFLLLLLHIVIIVVLPFSPLLIPFYTLDSIYPFRI